MIEARVTLRKGSALVKKTFMVSFVSLKIV